MRDRGRNRNRGSAAGCYRWTPRRIPSVHSWWRADLGTDVVNAAITNWTDQINGKLLTQATVAKKFTHTSSDAAYAGQATLAIPTTGWMDSTGATSMWPFLSNGTGADIFVVGSMANTGAYWYLSATANAASQVGFHAAINIAASQVYRVSNGSGTHSVNSSVGGSPGTGPHLFRFSLADSSTPKWLHERDGATIASGSSYGAALSTSNPVATLRVGGDTSGAATSAAKIAELVILSARASATELANLERYFASRYGLTIA